jgi:ribulose bisphosphate carboxylase small subunit
LGIVEKDKKERTKLTDQEIGEYVRKRLAEGYSIALYPQASGKMFTVQTCHPTRP